MTTKPNERGSVLATGLIMLLLVTLIAVTAVTMGSTSVQIAGNAQFREEAAAAAQQAIEKVISSTAFTLTPPTQQDIDINKDSVIDYTVQFSPAPSCIAVKAVTPGEVGVPKQCFGTPGTTYCYWTTWNITAVVDDSKTGARATISQGVRLVAGLNAALASCGV